MILPYFLLNLTEPPPPPTGPTTIREAIYRTLTEVFNGPVYFYALPQQKSYPAVTYYVPSQSFSHHLGGPSGIASATVRVSAWSQSALEAAAIADEIRESLDGFTGLIGQVVVLGTFVQDSFDLPEIPRDGSDRYLYQIVTPFTVVYRVP